MKLLTVILFSITLFWACQEEFVPNIKQPETGLVVEGCITTKTSVQTVKLTNSKSFTDRPYFTGVAGANVYVLDDLGNHFQFMDSNGKGIYQTSPEEQISAQIGRTYTLVIETAEGDIYKSLPQRVNRCAEIKDAYIEPAKEIILTEDSYGDPQEIILNGIKVCVDAQGILVRHNYYLYVWQAYEEYRTMITYDQINMDNIYRHRSLRGNYVYIIRTGNADEFSNKLLRKNKLVFIPEEVMLNYTPIFPDSFILINYAFEGLLFKLEQRSLSADAYSFYKESEEQLEAGGKLFDPVSSQLTGNIYCASDSTKQVYGVFYASDVAVRYNYFYFNYADHTYSMEIDSFPELWIDTCSWRLPDGWISPPI